MTVFPGEHIADIPDSLKHIIIRRRDLCPEPSHMRIYSADSPSLF